MNKEDIRKWDEENVVYCWRKQKSSKPIIMSHTDGVYQWDIDGKRYMDFCAGLLCVNIGHGNKHVLGAMQEQMGKMCYVGSMFGSEPRAILAKMISELTPGDLNHVFFVNGGAEAVENAIKSARWYTGRQKIYSAWRGYHGATAGAISITGDPRRWPTEPGIPGAVKFFNPYCYRCPFGYASEKECKLQCLETLKSQVVLEGAKSIAAIIIEPIVGTSGIIVPPKAYVQGIRQICDENGIVMIADEVMSGWGRSGKWFGIEHFDVVPDIITTAKGLTSAYIPLGAVIWNKEIWEHFCEHPFVGGLTYAGHALACATGIANIEVYKKEGLIEKSRVDGDYLGAKLVELKEKHASVGDVRWKGLWACIELVADKKTKEPLAGYCDAKRNVSGELNKRLIEMGLTLFAKWDFIFISPPLIITRDQIDDAISMIDKALEYTDGLVKQ